LGGRIWTREESSENEALELGAEFVHGDAPETVRIAEAAGLELIDVEGRQLWARDGSIEADASLERAHRAAMNAAADAAKKGPDRSFAQALADAGVQEPGRSLALAYVGGFDAADPDKLSARALAAGDIGADRARRFARGYRALVEALVKQLDGVPIHLGCAARAVAWQRGKATVDCRDAEFESRRIIVALPLGVLDAAVRRAKGALLFEPGIEAKARALDGLALGHVVRLSLSFREAFWDHSPMREPGSFLRVVGPFAAVWNGVRRGSRVLVAWAGGPVAEKILDLDQRELALRALSELGTAFGIVRPELEKKLVESTMHRWSADALSRASYSYPLVGGADAGEELAAPIEDTLFFAGEAACPPPENGTVEGALASGRRAARQILDR
jgi:monoamine oxidase